jgi:hypothetical protein
MEKNRVDGKERKGMKALKKAIVQDHEKDSFQKAPVRAKL